MPDLGLIFCAAGPILIVALGMWIYNLSLLLRYEKTTGTIVGYKTRRDGKGSSTQAEIVEFPLPNGEKVTFTDKAYMTHLVEWEGRSVRVLYDPNQPTSARVNKFSNLHLAPTILTIVGLGIVAFSLPEFREPVQKLMDFFTKFVGK